MIAIIEIVCSVWMRVFPWCVMIPQLFGKQHPWWVPLLVLIALPVKMEMFFAKRDYEKEQLRRRLIIEGKLFSP